MARRHDNDPATHREKANDCERQIEALEALRNEVLEADRIGETRLSELFHEARTSRPDVWKSATAFINIVDGEAVVDHVEKLRDGYWSPETRDRFDALISVGVRPFMDSATFRGWAGDEITQKQAALAQNAHAAREHADYLEHRQERRA